VSETLLGVMFEQSTGDEKDSKAYIVSISLTYVAIIVSKPSPHSIHMGPSAPSKPIHLNIKKALLYPHQKYKMKSYSMFGYRYFCSLHELQGK